MNSVPVATCKTGQVFLRLLKTEPGLTTGAAILTRQSHLHEVDRDLDSCGPGGCRQVRGTCEPGEVNRRYEQLPALLGVSSRG